MNCNCRVVHILIHCLTQHTDVLLQVVPQEVDYIMGSGVDQVNNSLQQIQTPKKLLHHEICVTCQTCHHLTL